MTWMIWDLDMLENPFGKAYSALEQFIVCKFLMSKMLKTNLVFSLQL